MNTRKLEIILLQVLVASLMCVMPVATPPVFSSQVEKVNSEGSSPNRVLYLNDSWNDLPNDLKRQPYYYAFAEIKKIEVEGDAIVITANSTVQNSLNKGYYFVFFDTNFDNITEMCLGLDESNSSRLYRYSDKAFHYNGIWHSNVDSSRAGQFDGTFSENATTGETAIHLCGIINGTMKIKVASMTRSGGYTGSGPWMGDIVPGGNFPDGVKLGIQPLYRNHVNDVAFPYSNTTVEIETGELPPPPPPTPPEVQLNLFVQMAVWGMQTAIWFKEGVINLPFWVRDNAVSGSLIFTILLLSSYSFIKKRRTNKQRLKKIRESLKQSV